ncbi:hypothetical protein DSLASN_05400 [Desulfoluna limicola]|uniref:Calcineurin-like phosphoesterase domain-containing protein n=1 Tax=Desulfoluna limicola TaxID=2810562 RepID=A0ABN6EZ23_9BACT|nr:metallophosphoesterase [Desulfoluna limicola]BCS94908.1 hypothetical protein DSLASN_05400 [Desulfoluna limicola]
MRILHLSDLHYGKKYQHKIERMLPSFLDKLDQVNNCGKIDLIVFTGDLVWSVNRIEDFDEVNEMFIKPILERISLESIDFIICPGNHDMTNQTDLPAIKDYIDKFSNNSELDAFVETHDAQFDLSYNKSENYLKFIKDYYPKDNTQQLFHTFERNIKGRNIGIVSFHTAWRSFIGEDSGHLLIPLKTVYEASSLIKNNDLCISLMHHSLSDLKLFNKYEVEDVIYEKFHINFSGHYHKKKQEVVFTHDIGMLSISSMASMSGNDGSTIGFSIVDVDIDTFDISIDNYGYIYDDNVFVEKSTINHNIPMNKRKSQQIKILKSLKAFRHEILHEANSLLINYEEIGEKTFLDFFNNPVLKKESYYESIESQSKLPKIDMHELNASNFIVYGKDKFGKTSLLRRVQLYLIDSFIKNKTIPIYIDLNNINSIKNYNLHKEIIKIFHVSKSNALKLIEEYKFHILMDNFSETRTTHLEVLENIHTTIKNYLVTLTSEENQESYIGNGNICGTQFEKLFIHPVTRKRIRSHASCLLTDCDSEKTQEIIQKAISLFGQMNIPFNYWHLSLFVWIHKKESSISLSDNVEMLTLYVDKLLEREQIAKFDKDIDYELFKKLLGELSYNLISQYKDDNYSISYLELFSFITSFKERNIRFITDEQEIIDYLLDKGVLKKIRSVNRYTFRLNGVMEYFTAIYMVEHPEFTDRIIESDEYFLVFANEIEILAGLNRKNIDLLKKVHNKVDNALGELNGTYNQNPDIFLSEKIQDSNVLAKTIAGINVEKQIAIPLEQQDEIFDGIRPVQDFNEEVQVKEPIPLDKEYSLSQLDKHVFILARAFRGLSLIDDEQQMNLTFELIINSYINIGFEFFNEIEFITEKNEVAIEKRIINLLTSFIPIATQMMISEALLHKTLTRFIDKQIKNYEEDIENNQYKLMILYFMMLDTDLRKNQGFIDDIKDNISMLSLKNISIVKFMYLVLFKSNGDKSLEDKLKKAIVELQLTLNPKADKGQLIQTIERKLLSKP